MTKLSAKSKTGETARALLMEVIQTLHLNLQPAACADRIIKHLEDHKFVIAPKPYEPPARRGKGKPPKYTGPTMIGASHSANLVRGAIT